MKRSLKIWLIAALVLVAIGMIVFLAAFAVLDFDFGRLDTMNYETNIYEVEENFDKISVNVKTEDVLFKLSEDGKCKVECYEREKVKHDVTVDGKELKIKTDDTRKWWDHISLFSFKSSKITVYLPNEEYLSLNVKAHTGKIDVSKDFTFGDLDISVNTSDVTVRASVTDGARIKSDTGKVTLEDISLGSADISCDTGNINIKNVKVSEKLAAEVNTGKIKLSDVICKDLDAQSDTGDIDLERVIAEGKFNISADTGDVKFDKCDAAEIYVETDTGDVRGTLNSDKIFFTKTDTGKIDVPKTTSGGRCEIETDTGDIKITVN
ncbi:MAG: DUF4097 domain-containing protein [Ruminococcaceae bacterium]|nr:DUF4097 domain-containing protein [Oscillospiraceae bacterium]